MQRQHRHEMGFRMDHPTETDTTTETVRETDMGARPSHPALARAYDAATGRVDHGEITSYDRMHHRHNRS